MTCFLSTILRSYYILADLSVGLLTTREKGVLLSHQIPATDIIRLWGRRLASMGLA
jgi:hypothetical protein